jgi:hypothetical protein
MTVAVNIKRIENQIVPAIGESNELILAVPRINSGGMYTLETSPFAAEVVTWVRTLTAQVYDLRILGATPRGNAHGVAAGNERPARLSACRPHRIPFDSVVPLLWRWHNGVPSG